jgi:hypothetical protein
MENENIQETIELAKKASARGTFSISEALLERAYPVEEVKVYLDEQTAYAIVRVDEQIEELEEDASSTFEEVSVPAQKQQSDLIDHRKELYGKLQESLYTFHVTGVSEGARQELLEKAFEQFPQEYIEDKNILGDVKRTEKDNPDRDNFFTMMLWEKSIVKVVAPSGSEQVGVTEDDVRVMRKAMPVSAITKMNNSMDKLRVSTAMFLLEVNEDFLAKP